MAEANEAATPSPQQPISYAEAAARFGSQRQAQGTNNPVSEAARTMAAKAAEARAKVRQAKAEQANQAEAPVAEAEQQPESDTAIDATASETDDQSHLPEGTETEAEEVTASFDENAEYDLGDGIKMPAKEIRENLLRQADYTRKTQAHAETVKAFESDRTQRLTLLDNAVLAAQQLLGAPKDPEALIEEYGYEEGMKAYFRQVKQFQTLGEVIQARQNEQAHHVDGRKKHTIKELANSHGDKAEQMFNKAAKYVAEKTGTDLRNVEAMLSHPEAVALVLDGIKQRELDASKPAVTKMVAGKPPVIKPGSKVSAQASAQNGIQKQTAALKASGSMADAVALLRAKRATRTG